uniref:Uncharacterized protein n=1 Tax=Romanomermis culicivorax TaxID=13658 RepID=A0A915KLW8_ROMCU
MFSKTTFFNSGQKTILSLRSFYQSWSERMWNEARHNYKFNRESRYTENYNKRKYCDNTVRVPFYSQMLRAIILDFFIISGLGANYMHLVNGPQSANGAR